MKIPSAVPGTFASNRLSRRHCEAIEERWQGVERSARLIGRVLAHAAHSVSFIERRVLSSGKYADVSISNITRSAERLTLRERVVTHCSHKVIER